MPVSTGRLDTSSYTAHTMICLVHAQEASMRRKRWVISLVIVLTLGTFTACGGNGDDDDEDDDGHGRAPQVALLQH